MMSGDRYLAFVLASLVIAPVPGPSVLFVISRAVALGRGAAIATVIGNSAGVFAQAVAVAFGVGVLVEQSAVLFNVIKLAGAGYLVYLGIRTFRERRELAEVFDATIAPRSTRRILREGAIVGLMNPKVAVFFAAILPQFADPSRGHVPLQLVLLGFTFSVIVLVSDSLWGLMAGSARAWFMRSPGRLRLVGGAGGLTIVGLGLSLAFAGRKTS
ncbi:MAG: LysE family translocator [Actinobacteria bacterium]|nr:LysE family translocator [Actinomycetota bacterium]